MWWWECFRRIFSNLWDVEVEGIDISKYAIEAAINKKVENSNSTVYDARNLNINDDTYDLVYSIGVIEHFEKKTI